MGESKKDVLAFKNTQMARCLSKLKVWGARAFSLDLTLP
tara:strand:- start:129 stop:245 length:117 start_codon:yes stop_codon:yes gene_type:complete